MSDKTSSMLEGEVALGGSMDKSLPSPPTWRIWTGRREFFVLLLLFAAGVLLSLRTDAFLTAENLANVARAFSWVAVAAFGESLVIIIGGIDLSVGAVMALAGLVATIGLQGNLPVPLAILGGLLAGILVGWVNGLLVGRTRLAPFIVTLATMTIARGVAFGLTGGWPLRDLPFGFRILGQYDFNFKGWSLPMPVLIMLAVALVVFFFMEYTVLGRYIYTLGGSERALHFSGVNLTRIKILVYILCSTLAALGGLLMTARLGVAAPTAAIGYELDIIAAAVIGGTSLFGGEGSILGVLLGAAFLQVLRNGLVILGFPTYWQAAVIGGFILAALLLDYWRRSRG